MKKLVLGFLFLGLFNFTNATTNFSSESEMVVYKHPKCGCCSKWIKHIQKKGFKVKMVKTTDLDEIKNKYGVPEGLRSCHTGIYKGHVFEGHIPAEAIIEFLASPNGFKGLSVPDMPLGSPGMESGNQRERYDVHAFDENGKTKVFKTYN